MEFQYRRNHSKDVFDAVETNDLGSLQRLEKRGLIKNYTEHRHMFTHRTPLLEAVRLGRDYEIIKILFENGANPFVTADEKGILHFSVEFNEFEKTRFILENCCQTLENQLLKPENFKNASIEQEKLNFVNQRDRYGQTTLHVALGTLPNQVDTEKQENLLRLVKLLLEYGSDVNAINETGQSPIFRCVDSRFTEIAKCLLQHGAKTNVIDDIGRTPLFSCIEHIAIVNLLVLAGADVKFEDEHKTTPLHNSVKFSTVTQFLISKGADINSIDNRGNTPIYNAVNFGNLESIKILFKAGANIFVRNYMNNTLLHTALRQHNSAPITEFLIKQHLDVNAKNLDGTTPLMMTAQSRSLTSAMLLWQEGVDIHSRNNEGMSALDLVSGDGEWTETNPVYQFLKAEICRQRNMAFAMAYHDRLGAASKAKILEKDSIQLVLNMLNGVE